jgi:hypothetical protein
MRCKLVLAAAVVGGLIALDALAVPASAQVVKVYRSPSYQRPANGYNYGFNPSSVMPFGPGAYTVIDTASSQVPVPAFLAHLNANSGMPPVPVTPVGPGLYNASGYLPLFTPGYNTGAFYNQFPVTPGGVTPAGVPYAAGTYVIGYNPSSVVPFGPGAGINDGPPVEPPVPYFVKRLLDNSGLAPGYVPLGSLGMYNAGGNLPAFVPPYGPVTTGIGGYTTYSVTPFK